MAKYVKSTFKLTPNNLFFYGDFYQNRSYKWGINDDPIPTTGYGYTIFNTFYNLIKTTSLEYKYYTLSKFIKDCNYSEAVNQCEYILKNLEMDNNYLPKDALQDNVNNILFWTLPEIDENAKNSKIHQQVTNIINKYDDVHSSGTYEAYYDKYCSGSDG